MNVKEDQVKKIFDLSHGLKLAEPLTSKIKIIHTDFKRNDRLKGSIFQNKTISNKEVFIINKSELPDRIYRSKHGTMEVYGDFDVDLVARYFLGLKQA